MREETGIEEAQGGEEVKGSEEVSGITNPREEEREERGI